MVDRCGRVAGVVSLKHLETDRVGLVVPADAVARLVARYRAPRPAPRAAVERQLQNLLTEVRFRRNDRAARYFGAAYTQETAWDLLSTVAKAAGEKTTALHAQLSTQGRDPMKMSSAAVERELAKRLSEQETLALKLTLATQQRRLSPREAASKFLESVAADQFGAFDDLWLDDARSSKEGCMDAYVTAATARGQRRFVLHLHDEWGEWLVQTLTQVR
jgi:hypothetical protein